MNLGRGTRALPTDPGTAHRPQGSGDTVWRALTGATEHGRQSRAWTPTAWAGLARSFPHQRGRPQAPRQLNPQGSLVWSLRMGEAPSFHCVIIPTTEVSFLPRLSPGAARGGTGTGEELQRPCLAQGTPAPRNRMANAITVCDLQTMGRGTPAGGPALPAQGSLQPGTASGVTRHLPEAPAVAHTFRSFPRREHSGPSKNPRPLLTRQAPIWLCPLHDGTRV